MAATLPVTSSQPNSSDALLVKNTDTSCLHSHGHAHGDGQCCNETPPHGYKVQELDIFRAAQLGYV